MSEEKVGEANAGFESYPTPKKLNISPAVRAKMLEQREAIRRHEEERARREGEEREYERTQNLSWAQDDLEEAGYYVATPSGAGPVCAALKALVAWREAEQLVERLESERMSVVVTTYDSDKALRDARDDLGHKLSQMRAAADALTEGEKTSE